MDQNSMTRWKLDMPFHPVRIQNQLGVNKIKVIPDVQNKKVMCMKVFVKIQILKSEDYIVLVTKNNYPIYIYIFFFICIYIYVVCKKQHVCHLQGDKCVGQSKLPTFAKNRGKDSFCQYQLHDSKSRRSDRKKIIVEDPIWLIIWVFPKIKVPQNGWFMMENLIKMDDWGYHYFWKPILVKWGWNHQLPNRYGFSTPNKILTNSSALTRISSTLTHLTKISSYPITVSK